MSSATRDRRPVSLPAELTTFVGRRIELGQIRQALGRTRLLTLVGPGGVGKTRLALRAARDLRRAFKDGVTLVEFADVDDAAGIAAKVAGAFGLRAYSNERHIEVLRSHLRDKQTLLVLDNCEHMVAQCARLAMSLIAAGSGVRVLVTSRQSLQIAGEHVLRVPPLSVPETSGGVSVAAVGHYDAVTLFLNRARATVPGFQITDDNCADVVRLCRLLDGIPLAIELAVPRLRLLSMTQLTARLASRFDLLTSGNSAALPRQRTLQATVDWSYDLCSPAEQCVWRRLAVFVGSFEMAAAQSVCELPEVSAGDVPDLLDSLVDKSMVTRLPGSGNVIRYSLLESLRDYALNRQGDGDEALDLRRRHRDWFAGLAVAAESGTASPSGGSWYDRMRADTANLEAALQFCLEQPGEESRGLALAASLCAPHCLCGPIGEVRRWVESALDSVQGPPSARVTALWRASWLAALQGDLDASRRLVDRCKELADQTRDVSGAVYAAHFGAVVDLFEGKLDRAVLGLQSVIERHAGLGDTLGRYYALAQLAMAQCFSGDPAGAQTAEWCRSHANGNGNATIGAVWLQAVDPLLRGAAQGSSERIAQALRQALSGSDEWIPPAIVETLAWSTVAERRFERAARLFGIAEKMRRGIGCAISGVAVLREPHQNYVAVARRQLGDEGFLAHYQAGWELEPKEAIEFALGSDERRRPEAAGSSDREKRHSLTRREMEVAELVWRGLSNKGIAAELVISKRTAETHVEHILAKLGFTTRTQIVAWFAERAPTGAN